MFGRIGTSPEQCARSDVLLHEHFRRACVAGAAIADVRGTEIGVNQIFKRVNDDRIALTFKGGHDDACVLIRLDRKSTRMNSKSLMRISSAVFCLKKNMSTSTSNIHHIQLRTYTTHTH